GLWLRAEDAAACVDRLGRRPSGLADLPFNAQIAYDLYSVLLKPVSDLLRRKRLIIVPTGPLSSLPFQTLITAAPLGPFIDDVKRYRDVAWLGISHPITVLPSVSSLSTLYRENSVARGHRPFIGFGNPLLLGTNGADRAAFQVNSCRPAPLLRV